VCVCKVDQGGHCLNLAATVLANQIALLCIISLYVTSKLPVNNYREICNSKHMYEIESHEAQTPLATVATIQLS
jgi:hypothetical protein